MRSGDRRARSPPTLHCAEAARALADVLPRRALDSDGARRAASLPLPLVDGLWTGAWIKVQLDCHCLKEPRTNARGRLSRFFGSSKDSFSSLTRRGCSTAADARQLALVGSWSALLTSRLGHHRTTILTYAIPTILSHHRTTILTYPVPRSSAITFASFPSHCLPIEQGASKLCRMPHLLAEP